MRSKRGGISLLAVILLVISAALLLSACAGENKLSATSDKCIFIVGNGEDGESAKVRDLVYPGQTGEQPDNTNTDYVPCNSRDYIINNGSVYNANNEHVGDRFNLSVGYTKQHTKVLVGVTAYWTLNQTRSVMINEFAPLCLKFTCYATNSESGSANFSTKGWNGMLGEVFGSAVDKTMLETMANQEDEIWRTHNPALYNKLAQELSSRFDSNVQQTTGYSNNIFCGSGNSGWKNPNEPGNGTFTCTNVRFVVNSVENASGEQQEQANKTNALGLQKETSRNELEIAREKYGNEAQFWLGAKDTAKECREHSTCVIDAGGVPLVTK